MMNESSLQPYIAPPPGTIVLELVIMDVKGLISRYYCKFQGTLRTCAFGIISFITSFIHSSSYRTSKPISIRP